MPYKMSVNNALGLGLLLFLSMTSLQLMFYRIYMLYTDRGSLFDILTEVNLKMTDIIKMLFIHYMYI